MPNLYKSQNLFFEIATKNRNNDGHSAEWGTQFALLGDNLGVRIE
jgi:hypothetical protein